ncbi:MAG: DNA polymerase III subunit alpha [Candidatus Taylorbacteria bacterium RIFCSPHIGHO2_01_FULL_51_15]|uniref:DNA polymerase III subunit alpha n=1 Tax=Candidatus Taylorbacteria bacterium RIFCSPHIGHO2_01_FULL_51_15 TaxID=1802304 RepID=A0A1G2MB65_9BACT|nr:MAG: DNA polymerase III subunit alpha [Candidatus Taylorbacteria bacterium RIFCSPHIGHO2_01_FULL_51_15]
MVGDFIHLHTHSHYSLLSALPKIDELVRAAIRCEMPALALTDEGNLYGAIEFYKECMEVGIKPIIGVDFYLAPQGRHERESRIDDPLPRLVLLAKNETGYRNLIALVTKSHLEGFHGKPRVDRELLAMHHDGLIALLPALQSETTFSLRGRNATAATSHAMWYAKVFGKDHAYLEITHHPEIPGHRELKAQIIKLSHDTGVPLVAAHDIYYLAPEDRQAQIVLKRIQGSHDSLDEGETDFSFIDQETAREFFSDTPEAIENTKKIADLTALKLNLGAWVFPELNLISGDADTELRNLAYGGFERRQIEKTPETIARLEYELNIIKNKGYAPYFLVVADLLRYAHEHEILTTIRGSVAGSMVTYLSRITNVNPLEYKLPFERFLNPERPSAPDIDMDFADNRRDEMIDYAKQKYGEDRVAQIGTFGTMMARAAVRDVARALSHPYRVGDSIAKLIPIGSQGFPMSLDRAMKITPELKKLYDEDAVSREVINLAKKVEGNARHISVHAAGVVIAPKPLTEYVPLQFDPKGGKLITQYDMHAVEDAGLLKFDFLGIKNLAILADAVHLAKKFYNASIDIENVPLDDLKTFEMLARGETMGLFQLNGSGMTRFLKDLRPTTIHDINAMVALYRPGPMESIPSYIERKHNPKLVHYLDPRLKEILDQSYGVVTYQDDVLLIAIHLAGYSWKEADALRKAMGKKIPAEMEAQKEKLKQGFIKNGSTPAIAEKFWKLIEPFAAYGFNKAHAASYGKVAYQTAYMKANFPVAYMTALLTADAGDVEKISESVQECKRMGIPVLPPDINESFGDFTLIPSQTESWKIRFGLRSIKNFGESVGDHLIAEREKNGRFTSLEDFLERVQDKNLNKKSLEALIKCGALDTIALPHERGGMLANIDALLTYNRDAGGAGSQDSLFAGLPTTRRHIELTASAPISKHERLSWEKELLGLYISGHPLDLHREKLQKQGISIAKMKAEVRQGMPTVIAGIVEEAKQIMTKSGDRMAFVRIADFTGPLEVIFFPRVYNDFKTFLVPEQCIAIKGRVSGRNGEVSFIAEAVKNL